MIFGCGDDAWCGDDSLQTQNMVDNTKTKEQAMLELIRSNYFASLEG